MNKEEFLEYINEKIILSSEAQRLVENILDYIERNFLEENEQYLAACDLLSGICLYDNELKQIAF